MKRLVIRLALTVLLVAAWSHSAECAPATCPVGSACSLTSACCRHCGPPEAGCHRRIAPLRRIAHALAHLRPCRRCR